MSALGPFRSDSEDGVVRIDWQFVAGAVEDYDRLRVEVAVLEGSRDTWRCTAREWQKRMDVAEAEVRRLERKLADLKRGFSEPERAEGFIVNNGRHTITLGGLRLLPGQKAAASFDADGGLRGWERR